MQQGRSSTPFADTNRVWMDFFVRATEMVAGGIMGTILFKPVKA